MTWIIIIIVCFLLGTALSALVMYSKVHKYKKVIEHGLNYLESEKHSKETFANSCLDLMLGLCDPNEIEDAEREAHLLEDTLKNERSKLSIGKAELDGLTTRSKELDEVQQELENSSLEAEKELEMLRSQERELAEASEKLREELDKALVQLDKLLDELAHSQVAVERLAQSKQEMLESQEKIAWYEEQIVDTNANYMELKKAYDALDIEYAQLYEKQNM